MANDIVGPATPSGRALLACSPSVAGQASSRPEPSLGDRATSDEDEDGHVRPKLGCGNVGTGPPLQVTWAGKVRAFADGNGLCSPGRWLPHQRPGFSWCGFRLMRQQLLDLLGRIPRHDLLCFGLATGKFKQCPFDDSFLRDARYSVIDLIANCDLPVHVSSLDRSRARLAEVPEFQPFLLFLLEALLRLGNDPDWKIIASASASFVTGVPIGVDRRMPRTPAVYERKRRWRPLDESIFVGHKDNYSSAVDAADQLETQFR